MVLSQTIDQFEKRSLVKMSYSKLIESFNAYHEINQLFIYANNYLTCTQNWRIYTKERNLVYLKTNQSNQQSHTKRLSISFEVKRLCSNLGGDWNAEIKNRWSVKNKCFSVEILLEQNRYDRHWAAFLRSLCKTVFTISLKK